MKLNHKFEARAMGLICGEQESPLFSSLPRYYRMNCTHSLKHLLRGHSMGNIRVGVSKGWEASKESLLRTMGSIWNRGPG